MNLTTDAWIPALRTDGTRDLFSLQRLFAEAHSIRDLAVKPHERIALMRLLICITQAALDGPADETAWQDCRPEIQPRVRAYLEKWRASFELLGDGPRFLQLPNLQPGKESDDGNAATKLDLALATGNNPTLFDNAAGEGRTVAAARAALNLLSFQCFAPSGRIGVAKWNGKDTPGKGSSNHAPCTPSSMLHTFVLGSNLLESVACNLLTKELVSTNVVKQWGRPCWEFPVAAAGDSAAVENATLTYLGRLVPYSRAIRLGASGESIVLGNGLDYPIYPVFREASATVVIRKQEPALLPASTGRGIWRQLHAITVKRKSDAEPNSGPLALVLNSFRRDCTLWIGALVTDQAKIKDLVEATYSVPPALFDASGRAAYEAGVKHAEANESALMKSVGAYAAALKVDTPPYDRARQQFWTRVEQGLGDLFAAARELTPPDQIGGAPWGRTVKASAREAYERTCPRRTPRQIQAYAQGLRHLLAPATSASPAKKSKAKSIAA